MAYEVIDPRQREEERARAHADAAQAMPWGNAAQSAMAGGGQVATSMPPPPGTSPPPGSPGVGPDGEGKFVNFDRVLNANKDVAERASTHAAEGLARAGEDARSKLTGVTSSFNAAVNAGTPLAVDRSIKPMPATAMTGVAGGPAGMASGMRPVPQTRPPQTLGIPGPTTSAEAAAGQAGAVYGGPTDFTKFAGFDEALAANTKAQEGLALTNTPGGLQALAQQQTSGLTSGESRMDAALLGATGGKKFADVRERFKDLDTAVERASADAGATVGRAQDSAQATADYYQRTGRGLKEQEDAAAAKAAEEQAAKDRNKKSKSYDDYNEFKHEELVRDFGNAWDPTWYLKQAGVTNWSLNDALTDKIEETARDDYGIERDSTRIRWNNLDPKLFSEDDKRLLYDSYSEDEIKWLESLTFNQQQEQLYKRLQELKGGGK